MTRKTSALTTFGAGALAVTTLWPSLAAGPGPLQKLGKGEGEVAIVAWPGLHRARQDKTDPKFDCCRSR